MKNCTNCLAPINSEWSFCDACGIFLEQENKEIIGCEAHPQVPAKGICVVCGRPVCSDCFIWLDGKIICKNSDHNILLNDWKIIYRPDSEFEADAVVCNLTAAGIEAKSFSLHDYLYAYRMNENRILVFVKQSEFEKAKSLLLDLNLIENT